jgi:hypothetical protein
VRPGERWDLVEKYTHELDYIALAGIIVVVVWWFYRRWRTRNISDGGSADA